MWNLKATDKPPDHLEDERELDRILDDVLKHAVRGNDELLVPGLVDDAMRKAARIIRMAGQLPPSRAVWFFSNLVTPALRRLAQAVERTQALREDPPLKLVRAATADAASRAIYDWLLSVLTTSLRASSGVVNRPTRITMLWAEQNLEDAIRERYGIGNAIRATCGLCFRRSFVNEWILAGTAAGAYIACPGCGRPDRLVFEKAP